MVNYCYRVDDKCIRISPNIFVVKNQNGFNKALYEFKKPDEGGKYGDKNNYSKEELRKMVDNYPKQYPCVINLNFIWEISKIKVEIINNTELEILNKFYNEFKKEKRMQIEKTNKVMKLIDKDALVAEIKKRLLPVVTDKHYDEWERGQDSERVAILDIINTLEVKEVNLKEEMEE